MTANGDCTTAAVADDRSRPEHEGTFIEHACGPTNVNGSPNSAGWRKRDSRYGSRSNVAELAELGMVIDIRVVRRRGLVKLHNPPWDTIQFVG